MYKQPFANVLKVLHNYAHLLTKSLRSIFIMDWRLRLYDMSKNIVTKLSKSIELKSNKVVNFHKLDLNNANIQLQ